MSAEFSSDSSIKRVILVDELRRKREDDSTGSINSHWTITRLKFFSYAKILKISARPSYANYNLKLKNNSYLTKHLQGLRRCIIWKCV